MAHPTGADLSPLLPLVNTGGIKPSQETVTALGKLLLDDNLSIVWGLFLSVDPADMASITYLVLKFFSRYSKELFLMNKAITKEIMLTANVNDTESVNSLFRQNNFASKLLSTYCRINGLYVAKFCLSDVVRHIHTMKQENEAWSVNINKHSPSVNIDQLGANEINLRAMVQRIMNRVLLSSEYLPNTFRSLCIHLKKEAERKFPDEYPRTTFASVGSFIFLRFLCPALLMPHKYGILESEPSRDLLKQLTEVSKVLQIIANGVTCSEKSHLVPLQEIMAAFQIQLLKFLDELADGDLFLGYRRSSSLTNLRKAPILEYSNSGASLMNAMVVGKSKKRKHSPVSKSSEEKTRMNISKERDKRVKLKNRVERESNSDSSDRSPVLLRNDRTIKFDYNKMTTILQYLQQCWKPMRENLFYMDKNLGTKHIEDYIKLSVILQKMGIVPNEVVQQQVEREANKNKKKKTLLKKLRKMA